jgi:hypothetical protein
VTCTPGMTVWFTAHERITNGPCYFEPDRTRVAPPMVHAVGGAYVVLPCPGGETQSMVTSDENPGGGHDTDASHQCCLSVPWVACTLLCVHWKEVCMRYQLIEVGKDESRAARTRNREHAVARMRYLNARQRALGLPARYCVRMVRSDHDGV